MIAQDEVLAGLRQLLAMRREDPVGFVEQGWTHGLTALTWELQRLCGPDAARRMLDVDGGR